MDQVGIVLEKTKVFDGDSFTAIASFYDRSLGEGETPATVHYRVDNVLSRSISEAISDWVYVALGTGTSVAISIPSSASALVSTWNKSEKRLITVVADKDLDTQVTGQRTWTVLNRNLPL